MKANKNWIVKDTEKILRTPTLKLEIPISAQDQKYIDKMIQYIDECYDGSNHKIKPGIAVAANQVGFDKSVIYVHFSIAGTEYKYLLANPEIVSYSNAFSYLSVGEGCLSVDDVHKGFIKRRYKIVVEAFDLLQNKEVSIIATDYLSICLQHEIDHLHGILFYDHIDKKNPFHVEKDWKEI